MRNSIEAGEKVEVVGVYGGFYLANYNEAKGWIKSPCDSSYKTHLMADYFN